MTTMGYVGWPECGKNVRDRKYTFLFQQKNNFRVNTIYEFNIFSF